MYIKEIFTMVAEQINDEYREFIGVCILLVSCMLQCHLDN